MSRAGVLAAAGCLALGACAAGPDFKPPQPPTALSYAAAYDAPLPPDQRVALGAKIEGDWWAQFHSPALDQLMRLALADNQDLAAARSRLAQAREEVTAARGALLPQASLGATAGRQKYGAALFGPLDITIPPFAYYSIGPSVSAPLDLFGGARRALEQQAAYADYQQDQMDAAYLSLTANVAMQVLAAAAARAEIEVVQGIINDDERNVALVQTALDDGSATRTQLLSAQAQLATDRTLLPPLHQQLSAARHALAVLVGRAPSEWTPPDIGLEEFALPEQIPASLPAELVHHRPDILAAEAQLHGASAAIGVATANLYPQLTLSGAFSQQALTPGGLFSGAAAAWALAANITQPLFNGGRLSAERRAAIDGYQGALSSYRQVVVRSFGEVADRLQALAIDADQFSAQSAATQAATAALQLARRSYAVGNSGILDVLDAERSTARADLGLAHAKAQRLIDTALLFFALGDTPLQVDKSVAVTAQDTQGSRERNSH